MQNWTAFIQTIAQTVIDMIPEEWTKVYVYGEYMDGVQITYYYYYPAESKEPVQIFDIPELFEIDEIKFKQLKFQLYKEVKNLWNEFKQSGHEPWTTFTMVFDHLGKFRAEFGYEDLNKTDHFDRMVIWKYKYLGLVPKDDFARKILEEYLKETEGKAID